ncbi:MAG: DUF3365 domain-containing protein [Ferruginibacter sp.]|nr:DUF3365 domain-containing protein [Cytophagales bacterium]
MLLSVPFPRAARRLVFLAVSAGCLACGNLKEKGYDTRAIADEIQNRKIKRVTSAQLEAAANEWGSQVARVAQRDLEDGLSAALARYPLEQAAAYCDVARLPRADSASRAYGAVLRRIGLRHRPDSIAPVDPALATMEGQLLDAYRYNAENKLPPSTNVQRIADKYLLFTSPVLLENPLCRRCHGEAGPDLSPADYQKLTAQYNLDSLTNRKKGNLLGMWSITFEKKEMIKRMAVDN